MGNYIAAGVYVNEIDLSQYTPALSSTIASVVGTCTKGPIDTPTLVTNTNEFITNFGEPTTSHYMPYAALEYLRNGRQLWVIRVADGAEAKATISIDSLAQPAYYKSSLDISGTIDCSVRKYLGLEQDTDVANVDISGAIPAATTLDEIISAINAETDFAAFAFKDNLNAKLVLRSVVTGAVGSVGVTAYTNPALDAYSLIFGDITLPVSEKGVAIVSPVLTINAKSEGIWANNYYVTIETGTTTGTFKVKVYAPNVSNPLEVYDNLTQANIEETINEDSLYIEADVEDETAPPSPIVLNNTTDVAETNYLIGGLDGISSIADANYIGVESATGATGLQAIKDPTAYDVNLIAIPGVSSGPVVQAMQALCEYRKDCFFVADTPYGLDYTEAVDWHNGNGDYDALHPAFNTSYGATFYPWERIYDSYNDVKVWVPPSGFVLSQMAYTDNRRNPWQAPAGLTFGRLNNVLSLETKLSSGAQEYMQDNLNRVNPIVDFSKEGITIWGQMTLQRSYSALDRINVRRMLLYVEKVVATATKYLVFEPNDSDTWNRAVGLITPLLAFVKSERGIEDYRVVIDETTVTEYHRNRNEMPGKIFIIPTKSAEKLIFDFVLLPSGAEFNEATGTNI